MPGHRFPNQVTMELPGTVAESGSGTSWGNVSSINASSYNVARFPASGSAAAGDYSKVIKCTNFDFSSFDNTLFDVTGVLIIMSSAGAESQAMMLSEAYLIDENGNDFGSNMGGTNSEWLVNQAIYVNRLDTDTWPNLGPYYAMMYTTEQVVDIPYATYSSTNFGFRFKAYHGGSSDGYAMIATVRIFLQFVRKRVASDYGFEFFNASGDVKLSPSGTFIRHIDVEHKLGGDTGTFSMSDFNSDQGLFFMPCHWEKYRLDIDTQQSRSVSWDSNNHIHLRGHAMELPDIDWDDSTKVFTISTGGAYPLPNDMDLRGDPHPGFSIVAIHYK